MADHAAIRARLEAANDDVGIAYSIPADEWVLTCDKPTMQALRHAPTCQRLTCAPQWQRRPHNCDREAA